MYPNAREKGSKNLQLYEMLKDDILNLAIQPGEKVSESILAKKYGISRSPVRDALHRLEQEGLIVIQPQIGTFISDIFPDELLEVLQVKMVNDPLAAKLAANRLHAGDLAHIREKLEQVKVLKLEERFMVQKEFDDMLHLFIFDNCGNRYLQRLCRDLFHYTGRIRRFTTGKIYSRRKESLLEAERILSALENRDAREAYESSKEHIEKAYEAFYSSIDEGL